MYPSCRGLVTEEAWYQVRYKIIEIKYTLMNDSDEPLSVHLGLESSGEIWMYRALKALLNHSTWGRRLINERLSGNGVYILECRLARFFPFKNLHCPQSCHHYCRGSTSWYLKIERK